MTDPRDTLQSVFGFPDFRAGQTPVVERLLAGKSVLAIFPTGAGKSLCYQLPALLLPGVTLVISPLIALMKDQIDFLKSKGVAAARLDSTLTLDELRGVMDDLRAGNLKLLYVAPERLASERFLATLRRLTISLLAVDEAHCISEWGHNFRPDYMKLAPLARELGVQRVLALTATATPAVAGDIAKAFAIAADDVVKTEFHRKNLVLRVTGVEAEVARATRPAPGEDLRLSILLERIRTRPPGPTIVYVTLQKTAEAVAEFLAHQGLPAKAYHAGLNADDRHAIQDWFMSSGQSIVCATIAFGMGIDKSDIRYVYHYNLPKTLENYAQEIGRAGRDGGESTCEVLAALSDRVTLENFTYGDTPTARSIGGMLADVLGQGPTFDVSTYDLSGRFDIRPLVVETVLTYLELAGIIAATGPFYGEYKFQPLVTSQQMIARFEGERAEFVRAIFKCAQRLKLWWKLDLADVMSATGADRQRVVAALNYLEERGDLKLEVAGSRMGYRRLREVAIPDAHASSPTPEAEASSDAPDAAPIDLRALTRKLADQFLERERRDIERTATVVAFVRHEGCRTQALLDYFGEPLAGPCGHCDTCLGQREGRLSDPHERAIAPEEMALIGKIKSERHPALGTPRQLARFLCGITSPAATRAKLTKDYRFGRLADVPFAKLLEASK
ncbi:MAG: ATP-dependent DNA helicase RecQ [Phycisphaerae bacterium]